MPNKATGSGFYGWWLLPILCLVYSIPIGFALYGPPVINTYMTKALGWERGQINLGYTDLSQLVVSKFNGMPISRISDIVKAQKLNPGAKYDVVEFELDNPTVVIPRQQLPQADAMLATSYGIRKLVNVEQ